MTINQRKKLLLCGHMQHGKDTAAEFLQKLFGYNFESSSKAASRIFLYEALKDKYGYTTPEQCFEDRINHRTEWHDLICEYNKEDPTALAKEIMKTSDIYVGMRSSREIKTCKDAGIFDLVIGIYNPRMPEEPKDSFDIDLWQESDIVIPNAGNLDDLKNKLSKLEPLLLTSPLIMEYVGGIDPCGIDDYPIEVAKVYSNGIITQIRKNKFLQTTESINNEI